MTRRTGTGIGALALVTALMMSGQAAEAQTTDAPGKAGETRAVEVVPEGRGFFGRMWDRVRGRGNPDTEQGAEFHEQRRAEHEASKAAREQERALRRAEQEAEKRERELERERDAAARAREKAWKAEGKAAEKAAEQAEKAAEKAAGHGKGRGPR